MAYVSALFYGVVGIVVACVALLLVFQEKLVYGPVLPGLIKSYPITPDWYDLIYEDVWLVSSDHILLHSWFIRARRPDCRGPTILFFQENAGSILSKDISVGWDFLPFKGPLFRIPDIVFRLELVRIMIQQFKCNVFMLSYRGYANTSYAKSGGYPSQHGIIKDAQAALDHLSQRTDIDTSRIVVFGRSLGGAVGAVLAKNNPEKVSALILENTFTSILDMAGVLLPFLKWFIGGSGSKSRKLLNFVVRSPWNTIDAIGEVKQPVLFLSGLLDDRVPPFHMKMLYAEASGRNSQCTFVECPFGGHMSTWLTPTGGDAVRQFLVKHAPEKGNTIQEGN